MKIIAIIGFIFLSIAATCTIYAWNNNNYPHGIIIENGNNTKITVSNVSYGYGDINCDNNMGKMNNSMQLHMCLTCNDKFGHNAVENVTV